MTKEEMKKAARKYCFNNLFEWRRRNEEIGVSTMEAEARLLGATDMALTIGLFTGEEIREIWKEGKGNQEKIW